MCICNWSKYSLFVNDTATTEIYTLSLPDALPISLILCGVTTLFHFGHDFTSHAANAAVYGALTGQYQCVLIT